MNPILKKILPHAIAIAIFAIVTLMFFSPILDGKKIRQGDIMQHKGMSKEVMDFREKYGEEPLWTNSMFGGMPAYQVSTIFKSNLVEPLLNFMSLGLPHPVRSVFFMMAGFYLLMIVFGVNPILATGAAIAYGLSTYTILCIEAGHNSKVYAMAFMAPVLAGFFMIMRGEIWKGIPVFALMLAIQITCNHPQITYYLFMILLALGIFYLINFAKEKKLLYFGKYIAILAISAIIAVSPSLNNLITTYDYAKYTIRGKSELKQGDKSNQTSGLDKDYATQWSYGVSETFNLLVPNFKGGGSGAFGNSNKDALEKVDVQFRQPISGMDTYFGDQTFTSGPTYIGAIFIFLFVLGMIIISNPMKWPIFAITVIAIMLSWGRNFMGFSDIFFDYFPMYNKFRTVTMILVIPMLTIPFIGVWALKLIADDPKILTEKKKQFYIAFGLTGGLSLLFYIAPGIFTEFFKAGEIEDLNGQLKKANFSPSQATEFLDNLEIARKSLLQSDAIRSFIFILLFAGTLFYYSIKKFSANILFGIFGALMFIDLWSIDSRYMGKENYIKANLMDIPYQPSAADQSILADKSLGYRVLNISLSTFNDASTSYFHRSLGGYHGAKLRRYQELIENQITPDMQKLFAIFNNNPTDSSINAGLSSLQSLNMLNTRYIIYNKDQMPLTNRMAYGNAWLVNEIKMVENADEELASINQFNLKNTAIVDQRFSDEINNFKPTKDESGSIELVDYKANHLTYNYKASSEQMVVFSEIYYEKGWNAYVDGVLTPHFRANYVLRAMRLPAGEHKVEFKFEPALFKTGETISYAGSILLYLLVAGSAFMAFKKKD